MGHQLHSPGRKGWAVTDTWRCNRLNYLLDQRLPKTGFDDSRGTNWRRWSIYYIHTIRSGVDGPIWKGINTIDPGVDGPMFVRWGPHWFQCWFMWIWQYNQSLNVAHRGPAGPRGQAPPESAGNATSSDVRVRSWKGAPRGFEKGCAPSSS